MQLTHFIKPLDFRVILSNLCQMLRLYAGILLVPLLVSLIAREFKFSFILGGMIAGSFILGNLKFFGGDSQNLAIKEALAVTALAYLLFALIGAVAFLPAASFADGFFEAMSGFTTTGLSVVHLENLPATLLFFRAYSQWIGGAGIIVLSLSMLVGPGRAAFQLYTSEFGEENLAGDVKATAGIVIKTYVILTALGYLAFVAAGMGLFDALLHVMATVSTGGFSPHAESLGHYANPWLDAAVTVFMILGAIGFPTYYLLRHKGRKRFFLDFQLRYLIGILVAAAILFVAAWNWNLEKIFPSIFHAATALTTTGFSKIDTGQWPEQMKLLSLLLMLIGGCAGSTAGGLKLFRLIILFKLASRTVIRALLPAEAKLPLKQGNMAISDRDLKDIFSFFVLYLMLFFLSAALLVFAGFAIPDALFESASALGTVGLSAGITSAELALWAKLLLIFEMWAGRLEILPVLVVIYPAIWKQKRKAK